MIINWLTHNLLSWPSTAQHHFYSVCLLDQIREQQAWWVFKGEELWSAARCWCPTDCLVRFSVQAEAIASQSRGIMAPWCLTMDTAWVLQKTRLFVVPHASWMWECMDVYQSFSHHLMQRVCNDIEQSHLGLAKMWPSAASSSVDKRAAHFWMNEGMRVTVHHDHITELSQQGAWHSADHPFILYTDGRDRTPDNFALSHKVKVFHTVILFFKTLPGIINVCTKLHSGTQPRSRFDQSCREQRLHHAYLLTGTRGVIALPAVDQCWKWGPGMGITLMPWQTCFMWQGDW